MNYEKPELQTFIHRKGDHLTATNFRLHPLGYGNYGSSQSACSERIRGAGGIQVDTLHHRLPWAQKCLGKHGALAPTCLPAPLPAP